MYNKRQIIKTSKSPNNKNIDGDCAGGSYAGCGGISEKEAKYASGSGSGTAKDPLIKARKRR